MEKLKEHKILCLLLGNLILPIIAGVIGAHIGIAIANLLGIA